MELKRGLSMQCSIIISDSHATQAFTWLEQGPDEIFDEYLHHASELLSKIYHISDMSRISVEVPCHYAAVYDLNCRKLKDSIIGHQSVEWKMIEECLRDIHNKGARYEWAKGYCRAEFNIPDTSCIYGQNHEDRAMLQMWRTHFQDKCTDNSSNKFHTKMPTYQHHKGNNYVEIFCNNICFQLEPFHSRHCNQSSQVKICQQVLTQSNAFGKNRRELQLQKVD